MNGGPPPAQAEASRQTVLVAMSGGVDSSVAAALLVEQGHRVIGITMKTFCYTGTPTHAKTCCGLDGIMDARRVADQLGFPHYVFDMEEPFTKDVIDDFVDEYANGRTPNPCVRCNSNTKIPDLLRRGRAFGADAIATGHYARAVQGADGPRLLRGVDPGKDQTYFLWGVPAAVVPHLRFPVGALTKPEVRERARHLGLSVADKPESQEICFVPDGDYAGFLEKRLGASHPALRPGSLVTRDGAIVGEHAGYARYTVGQRKRLGGGFPLPLYVLEVRPEANEVVIGASEELLCGDVTIADLNWIASPPDIGESVLIQVRHRSAPAPAITRQIDVATATFQLLSPQRAITPGQSGVVYRGDQLVGGGRIRRAAEATRSVAEHVVSGKSTDGTGSAGRQ
jgi:tRNA-uridine 2-sulfurtransferase